MESVKSAQVYIVGREFPVVFRGSPGDRMGYRFEGDESETPGFLKIWVGSRTLFVPLSQLDALELDV